MERAMWRGVWAAGVVGILLGVAQQTVAAERFTGGSYIIDASVAGNSMGGSTAGGSYTLVDSGGESVIGQGSGGSYKLDSGYVAQLPHSLQLTVQPGNLVAYYPMDESSGLQAADRSSSTQNLSLTSQTFTSGKIGNALSQDASATYATASNSTELNFQSSDFTISFWHKPNTTTGTRDIMSKNSLLNGSGFAISMSSAAPIMFVTNTSTYRYCTNLTISTWAYVTFVKQGTTLNCYINGVLANGVMVGTPLADIGSTAAQFRVGGGGRYGTGSNGITDEVKLFNRALSANEIKVEYDAGNAGNTAGLSFVTDIVPGVSQTSPYDAIIQTDALNGYMLAVSQNQNLTKGSDVIPAVGGSIAAPTSWAEGVTKGLGFTVFNSSATPVPAKWNSGAAYAAFPGTATSYYVRTGKQTGKDRVYMRLRLDVSSAQAPGTYTNVITTTGTITP